MPRRQNGSSNGYHNSNGYNNGVVYETENDGLLSRVEPSLQQKQHIKRYHYKSMIWIMISILVVIIMSILSYTMLFQNNNNNDNYEMTELLDDDDVVTSYYGRRHSTITTKKRWMNLNAKDQLKVLKHMPSKKVPPGCETTVMIVRHCEKKGPNAGDDDTNTTTTTTTSSSSSSQSHRHVKKKTKKKKKKGIQNQHCSYVGFERAIYLSTLFGTRWPLPSILYALNTTRHDHTNWREVETLQPLADKVHLNISSKYTKHEAPQLAHEIFTTLSSGDLCGHVIVICWKHSEIPYLARSMGCSTCPDEYPKTSFDQVWELRYVYGAPKLYKEGNPIQNHIRWNLYSNLVDQNFDPLSFSYHAGDYPDHKNLIGGGNVGGRWAGNTAKDPFGEEHDSSN